MSIDVESFKKQLDAIADAIKKAEDSVNAVAYAVKKHEDSITFGPKRPTDSGSTPRRHALAYRNTRASCAEKYDLRFL